jgi:NAD(P)-dependent dehydrogenase (short-subunit alcohol dehydrogenase family)
MIGGGILAGPYIPHQAPVENPGTADSAIVVGRRFPAGVCRTLWNVPSGFSATQTAGRPHARFPAGRAGRAEEVVELVLFLASDRAGFISGTAVAIDGGLSVYRADT